MSGVGRIKNPPYYTNAVEKPVKHDGKKAIIFGLFSVVIFRLSQRRLIPLAFATSTGVYATLCFTRWLNPDGKKWTGKDWLEVVNTVMEIGAMLITAKNDVDPPKASRRRMQSASSNFSSTGSSTWRDTSTSGAIRFGRRADTPRHMAGKDGVVYMGRKNRDSSEEEWTDSD